MKSLCTMLLCVAVAFSINAQEEKQPSLEDWKNWLTGSYSSQDQAEADSAYYNISLHMYPIWEETEGHYLYVEQALFEKQEKPYRQRVYALSRGTDGSYVSTIYTLPEPENFIGAWAEPERFAEISPDELEEREGCAVILRYDAAMAQFKGSTKGKECLSSLRGATYATSKVVMQADRIDSWDQGFDAEDEQVWGAEKGGYEFIKLEKED